VSSLYLMAIALNLAFHENEGYAVWGLAFMWSPIIVSCVLPNFCLIDAFWGPPSLLSNGYQRLFPWGYSGRGTKLTTHLQLVLRSRMRGAIPPLQQYVFMAWCSAKAQRQLYLYLKSYCKHLKNRILTRNNISYT